MDEFVTKVKWRLCVWYGLTSWDAEERARNIAQVLSMVDMTTADIAKMLTQTGGHEGIADASRRIHAADDIMYAWIGYCNE
jgi:hypothetical protein